MSEIVANSYRNIMKICILRPFFIYGPGNRENALFNKIGSFSGPLNGIESGSKEAVVFLKKTVIFLKKAAFLLIYAPGG